LLALKLSRVSDKNLYTCILCDLTYAVNSYIGFFFHFVNKLNSWIFTQMVKTKTSKLYLLECFKVFKWLSIRATNICFYLLFSIKSTVTISHVSRKHKQYYRRLLLMVHHFNIIRVSNDFQSRYTGKIILKTCTP
jgi:hypothetical protein